MAGAHPFYRDLWRWHAMEEEEHKAGGVRRLQGDEPGFGGYVVRCIAMVFVTLDFASMTTFLPMWILWQRGELFNLRAWAKSFWYQWIAPGVWRHVLLGIPGYFRPGFHPAKRKVAAAGSRLAGTLSGNTRTGRRDGRASIFVRSLLPERLRINGARRGLE